MLTISSSLGWSIITSYLMRITMLLRTGFTGISILFLVPVRLQRTSLTNSTMEAATKGES